MERTLDHVVAAAEAAVRLPRSAIQVHDLATNPETELDDLVHAIEIDPAFAARLLRLANSSLYSPNDEVVDLKTAIIRVGNREIAQLALVLAATSEFSALENELLNVSSFWNHSLTTAVMAKKILVHYGYASEGVFSGALLHDLGLLALFYAQPEAMADVLEDSLETDYEDLIEAERHVLGFDHAEVGATIASDWELPEVIVESIRYHHSPKDAEKFPQIVAAIALANCLETEGVVDEENPVAAVSENIQEQLSAILDLESVSSVLKDIQVESQAEATELLMLF